MHCSHYLHLQFSILSAPLWLNDQDYCLLSLQRRLNISSRPPLYLFAFYIHCDFIELYFTPVLGEEEIFT